VHMASWGRSALKMDGRITTRPHDRNMTT
jgi:hypothetical protein